MKMCLGILLVMAAIVLAGCSGGSDAKPVEVSVALKEWEITLQPQEVSPGLVRFNVTNGGTMEHQFLVVKNDLPPTQLPMAGTVVDVAKVNVSGELQRVAPGETATLELDLFPGKYVVLSNGTSSVGSHYLNGMVAGFLVLDR